MAEIKKYLDLAGLEIFWGKVKAQYEAADKVISDALAAEAKRADEAEKANAAAIKVISDDYLKASDKTELQGAINTEKGRIDTIAGDYLKSSDKTELEGKIAEKVAQSAYDTKVQAIETRIEEVALAAGDKTAVEALQTTVDTLVGDDENMSARAIVQDEVAKQLKSENISESFDTLKEMAEYLSSHPQTVTEMNEAIQANATAIDTEKGRIDAIVADYLKAADKTELQGNIDTEKGRIDAIVADYLKAADKTELSNAIATEKSRAEGQEAAIRSEFAAADSALSGRITSLENVQGNYASASDLTAEVNRATAAENTIEASVGLAEDGSFAAHTDKNYINSASSVRGEIVKLDAALKGHVDAYTTKVAELVAADSKIREDFAAADAKIREDFAAADSALETAYKAADSALETAYKAADTALSGRIATLEGEKGNYATKTELSELEASFVAITSTEIAGIFE